MQGDKAGPRSCTTPCYTRSGYMERRPSTEAAARTFPPARIRATPFPMLKARAGWFYYRKRIPRQLRPAFEGKHEKEVEAWLPQPRSDAMLAPIPILGRRSRASLVGDSGCLPSGRLVGAPGRPASWHLARPSRLAAHRGKPTCLTNLASANKHAKPRAYQNAYVRVSLLGGLAGLWRAQARCPSDRAASLPAGAVVTMAPPGTTRR